MLNSFLMRVQVALQFASFITWVPTFRKSYQKQQKNSGRILFIIPCTTPLLIAGNQNGLLIALRLRPTVSLAFFTAVDFIFQKFGTGALLKGIFRKPL